MNTHVATNHVKLKKKGLCPPGNMDGGGSFRIAPYYNVDNSNTSLLWRDLGYKNPKDKRKEMIRNQNGRQYMLDSNMLKLLDTIAARYARRVKRDKDTMKYVNAFHPTKHVESHVRSSYLEIRVTVK